MKPAWAEHRYANASPNSSGRPSRPALIDAACRLAGVSFDEALRRNLLGFSASRLIPEIKGWMPSDLPAPANMISVRHTVGMLDPLTTGEIPPDERVDDGLPQALEEDISVYGVSRFKVKIGGDHAANEDRLRAVAAVVSKAAGPDAVFTLDGHDWSPITIAKAYSHADSVALLERRLTPCAHCGNTAQQSGVHEKMKVCSLCRSVHYCSKQCSHAAWGAAGGGHSEECKRLGTEKRGLAAWLAAKRRQRELKQNRKQPPKQKASAAAPAPSAPSASASTTSSTAIPSISSDSRCASCGKTAAATGLPKLLRCSKCKSVAYCGAACQRVHWKAGGHKAACKKIRNNQQQQQQQQRSAAADE